MSKFTFIDDHSEGYDVKEDGKIIGKILYEVDTGWYWESFPHELKDAPDGLWDDFNELMEAVS